MFSRNLQRYCLFLVFIAGIIRWGPANAQAAVVNDSLEAALKLEHRQDERIKILLALAGNLKDHDPDKGLVFAREALRESESGGRQHDILLSRIQLSGLYWKKGDLREAIANGQLAMDLANKTDNEEEYINAAMVVGYIYDALGDYTQSTGYFFDCLKRSEKLGDKRKIFRAMFGIGFSCFSRGDYPRALDYYQKALALSREISDTTGIACGLNNISAVYGSMNDTQYIVRYVREAVAINLRMNNLYWVSINYGNLGAYYLERKEYDSAYFYLQKAYKIAQDIRNAPQVASASRNLANYYYLTGQLDTGLKAAMESLRLGMGSGLKKDVYDASLLLRDIYLKKNDLAEAYRYDTLRYLMKDSLDIDANNTLLSRLELQYELEKSAREKQLAEQKRNAAVILVLVILVAAIVIMGLLFHRHRLKSKYYRLEKEKLEAELEYRNKELATNVMSLMKKNEILSEITQRLIDVEKVAAKEETREAIGHIAEDLRKSMEQGIWDEFELRFRQVHKDFYDKLMQKYPDLSPNEQKLCAFLRLNMTNKEISELTGQSIKALETARYRLRIKFGLSNSQINLITFLSSL